MKRHGSSDSSGALISMCSSADEEQSGGEKKRRLSVVQVTALEKKFEEENKLEPERKVKLAAELGLQPRQVAVWFQNRRARWKTKQLERDYGVLKATYDSLKDNFESLRQANQLLLHQITELKSKNLSVSAIEEPCSVRSDSGSSAVLNSAPAQQCVTVKMEEHDFFSEDTCNFFSEDQAPTLHWWTSSDS